MIRAPEHQKVRRPLRLGRKPAVINRSGLGHVSTDEPRMNDQQRWDEVSLDDFTRRFALRAPSLMWFLGAGASASAGVPTAADLIWEFKQELFVSQRRVPRQAVEDLGSPAVHASGAPSTDGHNRRDPHE